VAQTAFDLNQLRASGRGTISVEEFSQLVGISLGSARKAVRAGQIPALRLGARWLIPVPRLLQLLGVDAETQEGGLVREDIP
jgi:excisionase family DNA binding protein